MMASVTKKNAEAEKMDTGEKQRGGKAKKHGSSRIGKLPRRSFRPYIVKTLRQVHGPDMKITKEAANVLDSMVHDVLDKLAREASNLLRASGTQTMGAKEVRTAVRLCFPGELADHAIQEADKAVNSLKDGEGH